MGDGKGVGVRRSGGGMGEGVEVRMSGVGVRRSRGGSEDERDGRGGRSEDEWGGGRTGCEEGRW